MFNFHFSQLLLWKEVGWKQRCDADGSSTSEPSASNVPQLLVGETIEWRDISRCRLYVVVVRTAYSLHGSIHGEPAPLGHISTLACCRLPRPPLGFIVRCRCQQRPTQGSMFTGHWISPFIVLLIGTTSIRRLLVRLQQK